MPICVMQAGVPNTVRSTVTVASPTSRRASPKIRQVRFAVRIQNDVLRLQIPVNHARFERVTQGPVVSVQVGAGQFSNDSLWSD